MKNKKYYLLITGTQNIKGFSLIEFLVASALSMIVLVAVSKGYFTARQLNNAADSRMNTQQDLRNAANMVVRDARMAGSFGCFNMMADIEKHTETIGSGSAVVVKAKKGSRTISDKNTNTSGSEAFRLENDADNLMPVRNIARADFSPAGFAASSDALVFIYGSENPSVGEPLVFSTCNTLVRPADDNRPAAATIKSELGGATVNDSEISVLRYAVHAYATGSIGGQTGFFRFQLNGDSWGNPQLLVSGVTGATFRYLYVNNCPDGAGHTETFQYSTELNRVPAFVRINLNGGAANANQIYTIDATIRGGNTCANRSLS